MLVLHQNPVTGRWSLDMVMRRQTLWLTKPYPHAESLTFSQLRTALGRCHICREGVYDGPRCERDAWRQICLHEFQSQRHTFPIHSSLSTMFLLMLEEERHLDNDECYGLQCNDLCVGSI